MNEPDPTDEPKPKCRSALRHALGGLALVGCLGLGMWMVEQAGWTDFRGWWRQQRVRFVGREAIREQVREGMTWAEVRERVGDGNRVRYYAIPFDCGHTFACEDYPEYGFKVGYCSGSHFMDEGRWTVTAVEDR